MTRLEVSNLGRYGFMGGRGGDLLNGPIGHRYAHRHGHSHSDAGSADSELDPLASGPPAHTDSWLPQSHETPRLRPLHALEAGTHIKGLEPLRPRQGAQVPRLLVLGEREGDGR
ncbi:hypothetical protein C8R45DRAFT_1022614 [Mycena sanguinolenta]|nr:hypothetical protein C8R45DRAFT_1022614 [Mycena sanguinolenta]